MGKYVEDITKQILEYVRDERYNQAVLIDGEWGTGKTYFVKEILLEKLQEDIPNKKILYISLYGLSTTSQIIDEVYSAFCGNFLEDKIGNDNSKKVEKGANIAAKLIAVGASRYNVNTEKLPGLADIMQIKESVIIFDDLERCEIEINQTLGMINNLLEHNKIKIILVANQKEIGKINFLKGLPDKYNLALDERIDFEEKSEKNRANKISKNQILKRVDFLFDEDAVYQKIKEKLIGLTIYYQSNLAEIFVSLVEKYVKNGDTKKYLLDKKQKIVNLFEEKKHYNIRTMIFAFIAFDKFYSILSTIDDKYNNYVINEIERVLLYTMTLSIYIKSGKVPYRWTNNALKFGLIRFEKGLYWDNAIYGYKFVDDYLLHCKISSLEVKETILEVVDEKKKINASRDLEKSLHYNNMSKWWELEDEEIEANVEFILKELREKKYSPRYFKNIIIMLMQIRYAGFEFFDYSEFVKAMVENMTNSDETIERRIFEILSADAEVTSNYSTIMKPLFDIIDQKIIIEKQNDNGFLNDIEKWNETFKIKCQENSDRYSTEQKFFYYIEPDKFISEIKIAKTNQICSFNEGVNKVYNFSNLYEYFKMDIPHLQEIVKRLNIEELSGGKKTKKMALDKLKSSLEKYLKIIEQPSS